MLQYIPFSGLLQKFESEWIKTISRNKLQSDLQTIKNPYIPILQDLLFSHQCLTFYLRMMPAWDKDKNIVNKS